MAKSSRHALKVIPLCWLLAFFAVPEATHAQTAYLQHFTTKEGLPSNNCFFTIQDRNGYIWVASDAGVSRFDGQVFENFSVDDGLPDNQILQLSEDNKGRIWFLALNGQLSYFFNGRIFNETSDPQLKLLRLNAVIVSFFQDSRGRIWLGTNKNMLVMWDGKLIRKFISANPKRQFINTFVHEDDQNRIWAYSNNCARLLTREGFKVIPGKLRPVSYKAALNMRDKSLAYINDDRLIVEVSQNSRIVMHLQKKWKEADPGYFHFDGSNVWFSTNSGIFHLDDKGNTVKYLDKISVSQVIEDARQNMWFTTNNGVYMLPRVDERLFIFNESHGLAGDVVKSLEKDDRGNLWLGFDKPAIDIVNVKNFKVQHLPVTNPSRFKQIKQISVDSANRSVYFASEYGLGRVADMHGMRKISLLRETNDALFVLKSFSLGSNRELAMALSSGTVVLNDRINHFEFDTGSFSESKGFYKNRAYCVFYDASGDLWLSNINGLSHFSGGRLHEYFEKSPLLTRRINDIKELPDSTLVLATDGYGIIYLKNKKVIKVVTQRDGLMNNICKKLFVHDRSVWVVTNSGINKIKLDGQRASVETFEHTSSLLTDGVNGMYIDDKYAYFATVWGLVYFSANKSVPVNEAPKVFITSIVNGKVKLQLNKASHTIRPVNNTLTFNYSAVDFQNKNVTYRYRLRSNASWTETKNRRLEFSSLEPGEYTFELSARSNNSGWSSPARINFVMEKYFWQTWWFFMCITGIVALAFYKIAQVVTKQQKNKVQEQLLLKNKILMLEQRALQAMMNPHFVFNVMNSIQHYINTKDPASANKILTGFARLIRKNLEICTKSFITLDEELEYLNLYLSLEKKRFGDKLNYHIHVDERIDKEETTIPSMILQPYVENAIWHGIMPKESGGNIDIDIAPDKGRLMIKIIDDGIGIENSIRDKKHAQHQSKGMELTKERINLLNEVEANPIQIDIKQAGSTGTFVSISIPLSS
ncbi:sensor histidine kinase [Pedobacter faecalis]|uniref:sensor histidine kinase n=1 Tax=Pedobacter faecalis TaxID=3041495 RepID=UPI00254FBF1C|nr:sensor histidine kinase [Pedobacter sp. ELA7]